MYKKIDVYVNGEYKFSTNKYKTCSQLRNHIRAVKHIIINGNEHLTIYDYDKLRVCYAK